MNCVFGQRFIWALHCVLRFSVKLKSTSGYVCFWEVEVILWCEGHHPELTRYPVAVFWKRIVQHLQYYWERLFNCNTTPQFEPMYEIHVEFDLKVELKLKMEYINIYSPSRHFEIREITKYMCGSSFLPQNKSMEKELWLYISQFGLCLSQFWEEKPIRIQYAINMSFNSHKKQTVDRLFKGVK